MCSSTNQIIDSLLFIKLPELEQAAALKYLYSWLRHHPKYSAISPPDQPENLYYADVSVYVDCNMHMNVHTL